VSKAEQRRGAGCCRLAAERRGAATATFTLRRPQRQPALGSFPLVAANYDTVLGTNAAGVTWLMHYRMPHTAEGIRGNSGLSQPGLGPFY